MIQAPYFIVGSIATSAYGEPRSTIDVDVVVDARHDGVQKIIQSLRSWLQFETQGSLESVAGDTMHQFRDPDTGYAIELFEIAEDPHDQEQLARRRKMQYFDRDAYFCTVEDSIIAKLRWSKV